MARALVAVPLAVLVLVAAAAGIAAPWSAWGWWGLASLAAGAIGLACRPSRLRRAIGVFAVLALSALVAARLVAVGRSQAPARVITLPGADSTRWLARILDEQDVALAGARVLPFVWPLLPEERATLAGAMHAAYVEMRGDVGLAPSPVLDTALARQRPAAFDTLVVSRARPAPAPVGVVFLHGYGGSFALQCWMVARAADAIGAISVCPAVGFSGHWSTREGEQTVRETLIYLRSLGVRRVYLAGLSNGALGASRLAPRFASSLAGLILISGAPADGTAAGLPALVMHGERDLTASARAARAFAARNHARYAGFDGGHFMLLTHRDRARAAIADWLREREAR